MPDRRSTRARVQRRCQSEDEAAHGARHAGKGKNGPVDPQLVEPRHAAAAERAHRIHRPDGDEHAGTGSEHGQQRGFREELPDEPSARGAERRTDSRISPPRRGLRHEQIGDVRAREQQQQAHGAEQHPHRVPEPRRDNPLAERHGLGAPSAVRFRMRVRQAAARSRAARPRSCASVAPGPSRPMTARSLSPRSLPRIAASGIHASAPAGKIESRRHHAGDDKRLAVQRRRRVRRSGVRRRSVVARGRRTARCAARPVPGPILIVAEHPPDLRAHAEHVRQRRRDRHRGDPLRLAAVGQHRVPVDIAVRGSARSVRDSARRSR